LFVSERIAGSCKKAYARFWADFNVNLLQEFALLAEGCTAACPDPKLPFTVPRYDSLLSTQSGHWVILKNQSGFNMIRAALIHSMIVCLAEFL
jgi:hypothetical protein